MNKNLALTSLVLAVILLSASFVSATDTLVTGDIYDKSNNPLEGADVRVTCGTSTRTTVSLDDGAYQVLFENNGATNEACTLDDETVTVYAEKDGLYGEVTREIHNLHDLIDFDLAVANVIISVPEFGVFVGALTLLSAVGIFFFVRKK